MPVSPIIRNAEVLLAGSKDYDRARRVWNASFDKKPALIVDCGSV